MVFMVSEAYPIKYMIISKDSKKKTFWLFSSVFISDLHNTFIHVTHESRDFLKWNSSCFVDGMMNRWIDG